MWGHQAQWDILQHPTLHGVWSALWGTGALLVTLDRCRFTPPWRAGENPPLSLHSDHITRCLDRDTASIVKKVVP